MANKNKIINAAQKYISKGQWDRAIKELQKLVAEDPSDVRTLLKLGDVYSKKGDRQQAGKVYKQVAESYGEQGFFLKAVAVYKQILKHEPKHLEVTLKLAELYEHLGLQSEAMQQYQVAASIHDDLGETKQSLEVLERMIELDTENVASRIKLAESYSRENMLPEAAEQFERAAEILKSQARIDDYIKVAERLVYHAPDRLGAVMELAKLYLQRGDTKRGLAKLQLCFKANPRDIETLRLLAQAFNDLGQTQKTVFVYRELARIYEEANQPDEARSVLQMILEVDPSDPEARRSLGLSAPATGPIIEEPIFTPHPDSGESSPGTYDAALVDSPSLMPPPGSPAGPSLAPRPAPVTDNYPPPDAAVPSDDEVLILDAPDEIVAAETVPPRPPRQHTDPEQISKILTETDVYIKYGLREKALEHLRSVFDVDPDNVGAYFKMRDIYVSIGDNARAAEAMANLLHVHARRGDVDALNAAREELAQLAPGHPLVAGGLPGAIPPPFDGDDDDQISIDIMEDSSDFLVDVIDPGPADLIDAAGGPIYSSDAPTSASFADDDDDAPDFSGFDTMRPADIDDTNESKAFGAPAPEPSADDWGSFDDDEQSLSSGFEDDDDDDVSDALVAADHDYGFKLDTDVGQPIYDRGPLAGGAVPSDLDELPIVTNSQVMMLDDDDYDEPGTDEHPVIVGEALDSDHSDLLTPAALRHASDDDGAEPSTDAAAVLADVGRAKSAEIDLDAYQDSDDDDGDEAEDAFDDELDEAEFLIQAELMEEAREALEDILARSPNNKRALALLASASDPEDVPQAELASDTPEEFSDVADEPLSPDLHGPIDETTAEDHYDQGMAFKDLGRIDDAIREFEGALVSNTRRITSFEMIGHCYLEKSDPEQAIEYFARAMEAGADGFALINLKYEVGAAYETAGAMDEAVQWFYACARDDPHHRGVSDRLRTLGVSISSEDGPPNGSFGSDDNASSDTPKRVKKSKISYL